MRRFIRCPKGHYREPGVEVCPQCRDSREEPRLCPQCGARVDPEARFCSNCRNPLDGEIRRAERQPDLSGLLTENLMTRAVIDDPLRNIRGGIVVKEGEEALIISGGVFSAPMGPGKYSPESIVERIKEPGKSLTLATVRTGSVDLSFYLEGIRTADPVMINVTAGVLVRIDKPARFIENAAKGGGSLSARDLHDFLKGPMHNAFSDLLGRKSVKELERDGTGPHAKKSLEVMLEHNLKTTLDESGLYLSELKSVEYDLKGFYGVIAAQEQNFIRNEKDEEEARELEKRIAVRRKTLDLLGDLSCTDEQIGEYLLEEEKAKLLRSQELEDIKTALEDRQVDHRVKRDWIIRKLELDQELDCERRRLLGKIGIDREVAEARYSLVDVEAKLERIRLENELADEKTRNLARIEMNEVKEASNLRVMEGLVELKKRKDRDAAENELFKEKEQCELRLKEREREMEMRRAMGLSAEPPSQGGYRERSILLRCVNPECNATFSVMAGGEASTYRCPRCSGAVVEGR
jgi:hypothetical protein